MKKREKERNWLIRTRVVNAQEKRLYSCTIVFMHVGQWPKISVVNGQTAKKSRSKPVKVLTHGRSCDYRVYGSDTPL